MIYCMFAHLTELLVDVVVAYTQALNNVTRAGTFRSLLLPRNAAEVSVQGAIHAIADIRRQAMIVVCVLPLFSASCSLSSWREIDL